MAGQNDFLSWATGVGALVETQAAYAANPAVVVGISPGLADPALANKTWRQSSFVAAALGQFIANQNLNALDDGNISEFVNNYGLALGGYLGSVTAGNPNAIIRQRFQGNATFFVTPSGSDANPGTSAQPWQTLQHAANYLISSVDLVGFSALINCSGAFTSGVVMTGALVGGGAPANVNFNFQAGSSVIVSNQPAFLAQLGARFSISGSVLIQSTTGAGSVFGAGNCVFANVGGFIGVGPGGVTFGASSKAHMAAVGAGVLVNGSYNITGGAVSHLFSVGGGYVGVGDAQIGLPPVVVTLTGSPAFTNFADCERNSDIEVPSTQASFTGSATGARYVVVTNGIINTSGGGASFLPGSSPGIVGSPPGIYL